jgi:lipoate-protein ligase B
VLAAKGIEVRRGRGGDDLPRAGPARGLLIAAQAVADDVGRFLRAIEESLILALARFGIEGRGVGGFTGVWCSVPGRPDLEKIASIGVGIRRWVAYHGFALNDDRSRTSI